MHVKCQEQLDKSIILVFRDRDMKILIPWGDIGNHIVNLAELLGFRGWKTYYNKK